MKKLLIIGIAALVFMALRPAHAADWDTFVCDKAGMRVYFPKDNKLVIRWRAYAALNGRCL
jgi:hypothetical protein